MRYYDDPLDHDDLLPAEPAPVAGSRRNRRMLVALLLPFLLGAWMMWDGTRSPHPTHPTHSAHSMTPVAAQSATHALPGTGHGSASTSLAPTRPPAPSLLPLAAWSPPTRITIPAIGLAAPVAPLGLDRSGVLSTPASGNAATAGWYKDGVAPGQPGSSLIVLSRAGALHQGERIDVLRQDGRTVSFTVATVGAAGTTTKSPQVTAQTTIPSELRLITSGSPGMIVDARLVPLR